MGEEVTLVFPQQLFKDNPSLDKDRRVFLVEDQLFFYDYHYKIPFHKKKLVLHRASMKYYQLFLKQHGYDVIYVEYKKDPTMNYLFNILIEEEINTIYICDPVDYALEQRLEKCSREYNLNLKIIDTPAFINTRNSLKQYFQEKSGYRLTSFYMHERRRLDIMMNEGSPEGKRWTFDKYNRRRMPGNIKIPELPHLKKNEFVKEAIKYVENQFPNHPGHLDHFFYPITHKEAEMWLDDFIKNKLALFGDYQDYIHHKEPYLFHSLLSSSINIGLLTPWLVVEKVLSANNIPLNSKEGFIRQIIGWREFLRAIYCREGCKQRTCNYLNNVKDIPDKVWNGKTGLAPFDKTINRVYQNAYAHHIERLMVIGNLFLLLGIHPDQVYRWFMMFFIDAYDWVMVPNVYGMSQYADGGLITTKPYVSSSNYLKNMSNYSSVEWKTIWDGLYWSFIYKNRELLLHNPRMALLKKYLKDEERLKKQLMVAESFLEKIFEYSDK